MEKAKFQKLNLAKVTISKNVLAVKKIDPGNADDLLWTDLEIRFFAKILVREFFGGELIRRCIQTEISIFPISSKISEPIFSQWNLTIFYRQPHKSPH